MKKFERGDRVRGTDSNADILEATVTKKTWEEIEIEWVEILVVNSTRPESIGKTFSVCTSYIEEIKPVESIQKVKKFKVGDHIKAIRYFDSIINKTLIDAEVTDEARPIDGSILSGKMRIKYIRFLNGDIKETGKSFWVDPQYFDYADGYSPVFGTVSSFIINGQEYTKEQYEKDCKRFLETFPDEKSFDLSYAMENILNVYQWAQRNPVVTNLDHYAGEFGWTEEQKKYVLEHCPFPFVGKEHKFCPKQSSGNTVLCGECLKWWNQEWKGGRA